MSRWTSSRAIERDLSLAQGGRAGAGPRHALGACDRPPALRLHEDTEEEYFRQGGAGAGGEGAAVAAAAAPDLALIQHMLQMVRDLTEAEVTSNMTAISKLGAPTPGVRPTAGAGPGPGPGPDKLVASAQAKPWPKSTVQIQPSPKSLTHNKPSSNSATEIKCKKIPHPIVNNLFSLKSHLNNDFSNLPTQNTPYPKPPVKVKKYRNIALLSIMEAMESCRNQNTKIVMPENVSSKENIIFKNALSTEPPRLKTESHEHKNETSGKVDDWMSQMTAPIREAKPSVVLDASNLMFKRKNKTVEQRPVNRKQAGYYVPSSKAHVPSSQAHVPSSQAHVPSSQAYVTSSQAYVPSSQAQEYYAALVEKSLVADDMADDIWTRLERDMKGRDEARRLMVAQRAQAAARAEAEAETAAVAAAEAAVEVEGEVVVVVEAESPSQGDQLFTDGGVLRDPLRRVRRGAGRGEAGQPDYGAEPDKVVEAQDDAEAEVVAEDDNVVNPEDVYRRLQRVSTMQDLSSLVASLPPLTPPSEYDTASDVSQ